VNLIASIRRRERPAGFPEGNLQGCVRGMGWSQATGRGLPRDAGGAVPLVRVGGAGWSSAERWCRSGVVGETVEVLSHTHVGRWLARHGSLSGGVGQSVEVLAEQAVVLAL